jgi:hypothetical protein
LFENGYGLFAVGHASVLAHRFSKALDIGYAPRKLHVDHMCKNIICVNPIHLDVVSPAEHLLRESSVCAQNKRKSECDHGHEFNEKNTYVRHDGTGRACRRCVADAMKKIRADKAVIHD